MTINQDTDCKDSSNNKDNDAIQNSQPKTGSIQSHVFPSGAYDFIAGFEEEIGYYQSCSLFSPMFQFETQEAAELTAEEALKAIMLEDNLDTVSQNPAKEVKQIWTGEKATPRITEGFGDQSAKPSKNTHSKPRKKLSERLQEPTSRRDFLRGKPFRREESKEKSN